MDQLTAVWAMYQCFVSLRSPSLLAEWALEPGVIPWKKEPSSAQEPYCNTCDEHQIPQDYKVNQLKLKTGNEIHIFFPKQGQEIGKWICR
jgi:hypothetical protein